jgi:hypothetical protein
MGLRLPNAKYAGWLRSVGMFRKLKGNGWISSLQECKKIDTYLNTKIM